MAKMQGTWVTECSLSTVNDAMIQFPNGMVFEQFLSVSRKDEQWRLLDYVGQPHTICYNEGIIFRESFA